MSTRLLAISGSLRAGSANTALVNAARLVAPPHVTVRVYDGLGALPHFNPDLDGEGDVPPPPVAELRAAVAQADALLVSSPEYAHGVPGSMKNALDWLVSDVGFPGKPVALVGASAFGQHARASLVETLSTMSARVIEEASVSIALPSRNMTAESIAADPALAASLRAAIEALVAVI